MNVGDIQALGPMPVRIPAAAARSAAAQEPSGSIVSVPRTRSKVPLTGASPQKPRASKRTSLPSGSRTHSPAGGSSVVASYAPDPRRRAISSRAPSSSSFDGFAQMK